MFIFTGIEMSSVYITRLENPVKTYIRGVFAALIFIFFVNILNALVVANVVPKGQMELNNIAQSISIYCQILGLPHLVTLLTVHSQDHLMTSIAFTDLAKEIIDLYRRFIKKKFSFLAL
ncbi:hypothetical protein EfmAA242_03800 [Enterococcus faecium]|nr:hypothetical protein EfmAA242_03800 [Enterococcus faecium]